MRTLFQIIGLFFLVLMSGRLAAQKTQLYGLEKRLIHGDKQALFKIAPYFDSTKEVIEIGGYYHHYSDIPTESQIARRFIRENCLFTEAEIVIDSVTGKQFMSFLHKNIDKIVFAPLANAFIITPLEERTTQVAFRRIPQQKEIALKNQYPELLTSDWVKKAGIDSLILHHDSKALLEIASILYKQRSRFSRFNHNRTEYIELLEALTHIDIAVEDEREQLIWHVDKSYFSEAPLNLLVYLAGHYAEFSWSVRDSAFTNAAIKIAPVDKEDYLFELLSSNIDSLALDAFIQLTTCDPDRIAELSSFYDPNGGGSLDENRALPIFPYKFLQQMVVLTKYCKENQFDFIGSGKLRACIQQLNADLSFRERRMLEDSLINNLSLDEITAFEYWALVHEESWGVTYSGGRILNIFYSKHWEAITTNELYLKFYLKKAYLFNKLGIIGICNSYLQKFTGTGGQGINALNLQTEDEDIKTCIEKAKIFCATELKRPLDTMKVNNGNQDYIVTDLAAKIKAIKNGIKDPEKMEDSLVNLLSQISYQQIDTALKAINGIQF